MIDEVECDRRAIPRLRRISISSREDIFNVHSDMGTCGMLRLRGTAACWRKLVKF